MPMEPFEDNPFAIAALKRLWEVAELPGEATFKDVDVKIPKEFNSLFSSATIKTIKNNFGFFVIWSWNYPLNGGNSFTVGRIFKLEPRKWKWDVYTKPSICNCGFIAENNA
jgi:hypothetical protein